MADTAPVRIAPHRSVGIDGRQVVAGEVVEVSAADAATLISEGYAVAPDAAVVPEPQPEPPVVPEASVDPLLVRNAIADDEDAAAARHLEVVN